jgi:hypothetical protein
MRSSPPRCCERPHGTTTECGTRVGARYRFEAGPEAWCAFTALPLWTMRESCRAPSSLSHPTLEQERRRGRQERRSRDRHARLCGTSYEGPFRNNRLGDESLPRGASVNGTEGQRFESVGRACLPGAALDFLAHFLARPGTRQLLAAVLQPGGKLVWRSAAARRRGRLRTRAVRTQSSRRSGARSPGTRVSAATRRELRPTPTGAS